MKDEKIGNRVSNQEKRLTIYDTRIEPYLDQIVTWRSQGMPEYHIAKNLRVPYDTWRKAKRDHNALNRALKDAEDLTIFILEDKLLEAATGAKETVEEWQRVYNDQAKRWVEVRTKRKVTTKPPSTEALRFYLTNKKSEEWRNRQEQTVQADSLEIMLNGMSDDELAKFDAKMDEGADDL